MVSSLHHSARYQRSIRAFVCKELYGIPKLIQKSLKLIDEEVDCKALPKSVTYAPMDYSMISLVNLKTSSCSGREKLLLYTKELPLFHIWHCYKYFNRSDEVITIGMFFSQLFNNSLQYNIDNFTTTFLYSVDNIITEKQYVGNVRLVKRHCKMNYEKDFVLTTKVKLITLFGVLAIVLGIGNVWFACTCWKM